MIARDTAGPRHAAAAFLRERFAGRVDLTQTHFATHAAQVAACAAAMADRFFAGGTLLALGMGRYAADAQHNAVEYVHPVLPGCRALPALALTDDTVAVTASMLDGDRDDVFARQVTVLGRPGDIVLALADAPAPEAVVRALRAGRDREMLTVALLAGRGTQAGLAAHVLEVAGDDAPVVQELHLQTYHILWELVHIVLNHRGIAAPAERP